MSPSRRWLIRLALLLLALNALLALGRSASRILGDQGGIDFHSYWFSAHFLWQGVNPYSAYLEQAEPALPVHYLDGVSVTGGTVSQRGLARTPANTAPMVLLSAPLALFSWPTAKLIWFGANLLLFLAFPWLVTRLWPRQLRRTEVGWLLALSFYGFVGSRVALWTGQTTVLVLCAMTVALLWRKRRPWLAGLLLGLALSKYSLALPVFVFLLAQRRHRVIYGALTVQLAGLLAVSLIAGESPLVTLQAYATILTRHTALPGIHLGDLLRGWEPLPAYLAGAGTLLVIGLLFYWTPRVWRSANTALSPAGWAILSALSAWNLVAAYHRAYDTGLAVFFVGLVLLALARPDSFALRSGQRRLLVFALIVFISVQSLPGEIVGAVLPSDWVPLWLNAAEGAITVALVAATAIALWLLRGCSRAAASAPQPSVSSGSLGGDRYAKRRRARQRDGAS